MYQTRDSDAMRNTNPLLPYMPPNYIYEKLLSSTYLSTILVLDSTNGPLKGIMGVALVAMGDGASTSPPVLGPERLRFLFPRQTLIKQAISMSRTRPPTTLPAMIAVRFLPVNPPLVLASGVADGEMVEEADWVVDVRADFDVVREGVNVTVLSRDVVMVTVDKRLLLNSSSPTQPYWQPALSRQLYIIR